MPNQFSLAYVKQALLEAKLRLKDKHVTIINNEQVRVQSPLPNVADSVFYFKVA